MEGRSIVMIIDLNMQGKTAIVIGGGAVGERKARRLLEEGALVKVVSQSFTEGLERLGKEGRLQLIPAHLDAEAAPSLERSVSGARVVVAAVNDRGLNRSIAEALRGGGVLLNVVDDPELSDFALPALAKLGDIKVAVSTGGSSPAMARVLRKRIEEEIGREDILQVKLQAYARGLAKRLIPQSRSRKKFLYTVMEDGRVRLLVKEGRLTQARERVREMALSLGRRGDE